MLLGNSETNLELSLTTLFILVFHIHISNSQRFQFNASSALSTKTFIHSTKSSLVQQIA